MSDFSGKTVLVTGASRGLGAAIARAFAEAGATVFVAARDATSCETVAASITASGGTAIALPLDVTDERAAADALAVVARRTDRLDVLVNNAALVGPLAPIGEADVAQWRAAIDTGLVGPFIVTRPALPLLLAGAGAVVNVGAGAAEIAIDSMSAYCATKAGLAMFNKVLLKEYGDRGLRVYGFRPGMMDTDMQTEIRDARANALAGTPRDTLNGPDVPAKALLALCGEAGKALSGQEVAWNDPRLKV